MPDPSPGPRRPSPADGLLVVAAAFLTAGSFLPWQRSCCGAARNAWQGNGALAGGAMAALAVVLLVMAAMALFGRRVPSPLPHDYVLLAAGTGAALFGLLKFLLVVARHPGPGAWAGLAVSLITATALAWRVLTSRST